MGVPSLESFMEEPSRGILRPINIKDLRPKSPDPVIIVDVMALMSKLYIEIGKLDLFCGGQAKEYCEIWRRFINNFKQAGFRLIFVYDGPVQADKLETWKTRRYSSMNECLLPAFDHLKRHRYPPTNAQRYHLPQLQTNYILSEILNEEVIVPMIEADDVIVQLAKDIGAIGVLTQDSDYVIYQMDILYLSAKHLDIDSLTTKVYDQSRLAHHLKIPTSLLPLMALLKGNDIFTRDYLQPFHDRILRQRMYPHMSRNHALIYHVRDVIKSYYPRECRKVNEVKKSLKSLLLFCFKTLDRLEDAEALLDRYFLQNQKTEKEVLASGNGLDIEANQNWSKIYKTFMDNNFTQRFIMLDSYPFMSSGSLEDYRISHMIPQRALLFKKFRQRLYGILLKEKPNALMEDGQSFKIKVREWCMTGPGSLDTETLQDIIIPPDHHPGLLKLLHNEDRSKETQEERFRLFSWVLSPDLDYKMLLGIRDDDLFLVSQLFYMQNESENGPILFDWEVKLFIVVKMALKSVKIKDIESIRIPPNVPDYRGVQIASLFCQSYLLWLLEIVGRPVPTKNFLLINNFDGKFFQMRYLELKHQRATIHTLVTRYNLNLARVEELFNFITRNGEIVKSA